MVALAKVLEYGETDLVVATAEEPDDLFHVPDSDIDLAVLCREPDPALIGFVDAVLRQVVRLDTTCRLSFEDFDFHRLLPWAREMPGYRSWVRDVMDWTCRWCDWHRSECAILRLRTLDSSAPEAPERLPGRKLVCVYGGMTRSGREDGTSGSAEFLPPYAVAVMTAKARQVLEFPRSLGQMPRRLLLTLDRT
ncbi:MAG TPA: DUF1826 domain-containing protein [Methylococcus sp.]|nr:DUF1826 domain-containing protein [Methylococcus sp.]